MKILSGFLALISSFFIGTSERRDSLPLDAAIISYRETYFAPTVAEPGNFPRAEQSKAPKEDAKIISMPASMSPPPATSPTLSPVTAPTSAPVAPIVPTMPVVIAPAVLPPATPPQDLYLATPEPIANWFWYSSFNGNSDEAERSLPEITFDREYWRMEVLAYWAPSITPPKPEIKKDYFKLEVYEKGTNKLVYTMVSGIDETIHKFQAFRKPGSYYFKIFAKDPSQYEITFTISSKLAQTAK